MRWWVPMANAVAGASPEAGVTLSDTGADFLVSFLFNFGLSVCMVGGFMIMRRKLAWFYIPNVVEQQHKRETAAAAASKEPELHDPPGALGWVWPTWSTSLAWFLRYRGMDAYLYLRFLRSCIVLFTILSLVGIIVLFPTNASGQNRYLPVDNPFYVAGLDVISMANLNSATDLNKLWGAPRRARPWPRARTLTLRRCAQCTPSVFCSFQ